MKLTLLPLQNDALLRVRCEGPLTRRGQGDPLQELLGAQCYGHTLLLSLERSQAIDTSGVSWLMRSHQAFQDAGGKLVLYSVAPVIVDVLDFLRLTPLLIIAPSEQAACALAGVAPTDSTDNGAAGPTVRITG